MNHPVLLLLKRSLRSSHLVFLNGLLCMLYPLCYACVVHISFRSTAPTSLQVNCVVLLNFLFLAILILTSFSILVLYRLLKDRQQQRTRLIFFITWSSWLLYVVVSCCLMFFKPGFNSQFYHFVTHEFRWMDPRFFFLLSVFGLGMSYMTWQYFSQLRMQRFACYLLFALLLFSYKMMLPYFLFMMAWIFYAGFHFCIYYEVAEKKRGQPVVEAEGIREASIVPD